MCQRRADGLVLMAETLLEGGAKSSTSAERYQVVVHVAAETLEAGAHGRCAIEDGPALAADTVAPTLTPDARTRLEEESHAHGPRIDANTCVPEWHGEVMDYAMAIDGLLARAGRLNDTPPLADP